MPELTYTKTRILELIGKNRPIPEIVRELNISRKSLYKHIRELQRMGYVERIGRGLYTLTEKGREVLSKLGIGWYLEAVSLDTESLKRIAGRITPQLWRVYSACIETAIDVVYSEEFEEMRRRYDPDRLAELLCAIYAYTAVGGGR